MKKIETDYDCGFSKQFFKVRFCCLQRLIYITLWGDNWFFNTKLWTCHFKGKSWLLRQVSIKRCRQKAALWNTLFLLSFTSIKLGEKSWVIFLKHLISRFLEKDRRSLYSWVARDVTKNQTKKLSILLSFCFHEVLQYLNIFT